MATFRTYKCKKCGFTVETESAGYYALMSGMYFNFKCRKCKRIVSISSEDINILGYSLVCPECNNTDCLSTWNPIEGHCPQCNGEMELDKNGGIILAD